MKKLIYLLPVVIFCVVGLFGCEDDEGVVPRLFRPDFISATANGNTITYSWRAIGGATSYVIEMGQDVTFETPAEHTETVVGTKYTFTGLLYNTTYYARVKALSDDVAGESNWTVFDGQTKTEARIVPNLLQAVEPEDIGENGVTLRWTIDEANPVDSISIVRTSDEAIIREIILTEDEMTAGEYMVTELEKSTAYVATLGYTKAPADAKTYNSQSFKTAGPPADAIMLAADDNFASILTSDLLDDSKPELVYYLPAGADYYMFEDKSLELTNDGKVVRPKGASGKVFNITKTVRIIGATNGKRPTLWLRGAKWNIEKTVNHIGVFEIDGVDLREYTTEKDGDKGDTSLFNVDQRSDAGQPLIIGEFIIKHCDIVGIRRGVFLCNKKHAQSSPILISKIVIDHVMYDTTSDTQNTQTFGFINIEGEYTDIWADVTISNSTFYNSPKIRGLFGKPGAKNYWNQTAGSVKIQNCTFFDFAYDADKSIVDLSPLPAPGVNVDITNCLIAVSTVNSNKKSFVASGTNLRITSTNNYYVEGWEQKAGDITLLSAEMSVGNLFDSPSSGNLTIKATESDIYKKRIGDPRWIN